MESSSSNARPSSESFENREMVTQIGSSQTAKPILAALRKPILTASFDKFEKIANCLKRWHNRIGLLSLVVLIAVLEFSLLRLVSPFFRFEKSIDPLIFWFSLLGLIPFVCALGLHLLRLREKWLLARYKAERIRHWKFQQFLDGPYIEDLAGTDQSKFQRQWEKLIGELDTGIGAMHAYVRNQPFSSPFVHPDSRRQLYQNPDVFWSAAEAYEQYRLDIQLSWFTKESLRYQRMDQHTKSFSDNLLFLSVVFAFIDGLLLALPSLTNPEVEITLLALGIATTILSAGGRVYRSASGVSENAERYQRMAIQLQWYHNTYSRIMDERKGDEHTQLALLNTMADIERLCHGELVEFVRVSEKSDYFL